MLGVRLVTFVFLLSFTISLVESQISISSSGLPQQSSFTATYTKSNPSFFGYGVLRGSITYDASSRTMLLTDTVNAGTVSNYYTYNPTTGAGLLKYEPDCSGYANSCEITDISSMAFWVLWNNPQYYSGPVGDGTFPGCSRYNKLPGVAGLTATSLNYVTSLWLNANGDVCGWDLVNGERYTVTSFSRPGTPTIPSVCNTVSDSANSVTCYKPMNLVFIVDQNGPATLNDINNLKTQLSGLTSKLQLSPQIVNSYLFTIRGNTVTSGSPLVATGVEQFNSMINSGFSCAQSDICNPGFTSAVPTAINTAALAIQSVTTPYRPTTSTAFVFITWGGFTNTASQISAALANASAVIGAKSSTSGTSLPFSSVVDFYSIVVNNASAASLLQTAANTNANTQLANVRQNPYSNITAYPAATDSIYNNVWQVPNTNAISTNLAAPLANGLCASNGLVAQSRSCAGCCGNCKCGVLCVQPDQCPQQNCFNQSLSKAAGAPDSSLCCILTPQCPGFTTTRCNITFCNISTGACTYVTPTCPSITGFPTNCFDRVCDPLQSTSTAVACRSVQKFNSTINACFQRVCDNNTNSVIVVPLVVCRPSPCATVTCNNLTGNCDRTDLPIPTPSAADSCKLAVCNPQTNNSYIWVFPNTTSCTTTDRCKTVSCVGQACVISDKCTPNTCTNFTCNPSVGRCDPITCPAFGTFPNGSTNLCIKAQPCITSVGPALSGCSLAPVTCNPPADPCTNISCVSGACQPFTWCPPFEITNGVQNLCRPRLTSDCTLGRCTYFNQVCNSTSSLAVDPGCVNTTCDPAVGCAYRIPCPYISSNRCGIRQNATCLTTCQYDPVICPNRTNICENRTCVPGTGCPTNYPLLCPVNPSTSQRCLIRNDSTCELVRTGALTTCRYVSVLCNTTDPCTPQICTNSSGACTTNTSGACAYTRVVSSGSICERLINTSCGGVGGCQYQLANDCSTPFTWIVGSCSWNAQNQPVCMNQSLCSARACFNITGYNASAPVASRCIYTPIDCSGFSTGNQCTYFQCNPSNNTCTLETSWCVNTTNRCNFTTSCQQPCQFTQRTCAPPTDPCNINTCDPQTGNCRETVFCPVLPCSNRVCAPGSCSYTPVQCQNTDPCNTTICNNATNRCESFVSCPLYQLVGGAPRFCSVRTSPTCHPCSYALNTSCVGRNACETAACNNATQGTCTYNDISLSNPQCPIFNDTQRCFTRDNSTCTTTGRCSYVPVVTCTTPANFPPCVTRVCNNGQCVNSTNNQYVCPPPSNPCNRATFSATSPTCCVESPLCTTTDLCRPQSCSVSAAGVGSCVTNPVVCDQNLSSIGQACMIAASGGACDSRTGQCTRYNLLTCPPQDRCTNIVCDNSTGACTIPVPNPACAAACRNINCPPVQNCTNYDCIVNNATGQAACVPRTVSSPNASRFCVDRPPGDYCTVGTCLEGTTTCFTTYRDLSYCETQFTQLSGIALPPCSRWTLNPFDPNCCSPLPNCNTGVDPQFQCMLRTCSSDNVTCTLIDNTDTVCPPFKFGNRCFPRKSCDNATGTCTYLDLVEECILNQSLTDPCFDGTCDPQTGRCVPKSTDRCAAGSKCINVNCPKDRCVRFACDPTNGTCVLEFNNTCPPLDNCTDQRCDPVVGCVPVPFNPSRCNVTDPCQQLILNGSVPGCCTSVPKCSESDDPICNISQCSASGQCFYTNLTCDPNEVDPNGRPNLCRVLLNCAGGCRYTDLVCNETFPGVSCFRDVCNPATGTCSVVDTCPKDSCTTQTCNPNTNKCEITSSRVCQNNNCTTQVCDPILGCKTTFFISTSNCSVGPCQVAVLSPNRQGCCAPYNTCVSIDPCVIAECNPDNTTCNRRPFCPPSKCNDTVCYLDANGQPACNSSVPKKCDVKPCEVLEPCVEDGQPFSCVIKPLCTGGAVAGDICLQSVCVANASGQFCETIRNPELTCDDSDTCTTNDCVNGTCVNTFCPTDDPCTPGKCVNGTCVYAPINCDDDNLCTNDTCVVIGNTATCQNVQRNIVQTDFCLPKKCDPRLGDFEETRTCFMNESCVLYGENGRPTPADKCSDSVCSATSDSPYIDCTTKEQKFNQGSSATNIDQQNCDVYYCTNGTCTYTIRRCPNTLAVVAVTAGVSALVIVGIILGIVIFAGCSGGAIYAVYASSEKDGAASVMNNPLFKGQENSFTNPLNKGGATDVDNL